MLVQYFLFLISFLNCFHRKQIPPDEHCWPQEHRPWTGWNQKFDDAGNFTSMATNPRTVHELTTPCSLSTIKLLPTRFRVFHTSWGHKPPWSPLPGKAIKAALFYFTLHFYLAPMNRGRVSPTLLRATFWRCKGITFWVERWITN